MAFNGFDRATTRFLEELAANNERDWFNANKSRYEQHVLEPVLEFISAMGEELGKLSDHFEALPKRSGGSLMRVYRDTRFSKDKTPYKTNIGIQFRHSLGKDVHAPGYYLHIAPDDAFIGIGTWMPPMEALTKIRAHIDEHGAAWKRARDAKRFRATFELQGESLKRPPRGYTEDHPFIADLKRKSFIGVTGVTPETFESAGFVEHCGARFRDAAPFMKFLCSAVEVPY